MEFKILVEPSGHEFTVEAGETILDAALRNGLVFPYGCRDGACGSCEGKIVSGEVDYPRGTPKALDDIDTSLGMALFCQATPRSDLCIEVHEVRTAGDIQPRKLPCRVARIEHLAEDVVQLFLKIPSNDRLQFMAGQYIDFLLKSGHRRAFSIANAPHDDEFVELQIRHVDGGEFTDYVFSQMKEKAVLRIEGPFGTFFLREDSRKPILMVGGGTGFAPLKGMIEHALYIGLDRPIHLFWGVRSLKDLYLPDLPAQWAREHDHVQFTPVLSEAAPQDAWKGTTGWVHEAVVAQYPDLSGHQLYMAGPPAMIDAAKATFAAAGLPDDELFYDSFEYAAASGD